MFAVGSFPALVTHDLRLAWRRVSSRFSSLGALRLAGLTLLIFSTVHGFAWIGMNWLSAGWFQQSDTQSRLALLTGGFVFVFPWMISHSINMASRLLYSHGDLDLWLASPIPQRRIVAAHATAIAIDSLCSIGIILIPLIDVAVLLGGLQWIAVYPALISASLLATAIGLVSTVALFTIAGPRRTRTAAQIMSTFIGAAFIVALQALQVIPTQWREQITAGLIPAGGNFSITVSPWLLPVYAAGGDLRASVLWLCAASFSFLIMTIIFGPAFCTIAMKAAGTPVNPSAMSRSDRTSTQRFRSGLGRILRHKEIRLVLRDPWLLSQLALQIIYTLPVALIVWRNQGGDGSFALSICPAIVVIASQISASLAWLAVSGEQAPELLECAPLRKGQLDLHKIQGLVAPIAIGLLIPSVALAFASLKVAILTFGLGLGAALSSALLNLWNPIVGRRAQMMRRHSQSKLVALLEHGISICWAVAMVFAALGSFMAMIPIAFVGGTLWLNRRASCKRLLTPRRWIIA